MNNIVYEFNILPQFGGIFRNKARYLFLLGESCSGKFYAGCQKIVADCVLQPHTNVIVVPETGIYSNHIFKFIFADTGIKPESHSKSRIVFGNRSQIITYTEYRLLIGKFDYILLQNPSFDEFRQWDYHKPKQMILTGGVDRIWGYHFSDAEIFLSKTKDNHYV